MARFHNRCGKNITLLEENLIAVRSLVEFLDGLVFSAEPLTDDVIFEVQVKGKVTIWNGGISIGVTSIDPNEMVIPSTSARIKESAWVMSGSTILKDGSPILDKYGPNLDKLREDDCLGILKTTRGELMFYINGTCMGVAAENIPERVYALFDLYGQCVKIRIRNPPLAQPIIPIETTVENLIDDDSSSDDETLNLSLLFEPEEEEISPILEFNIFPGCTIANINPHDNIRFYPRCGSLIKLSANLKSAERARPSDEYNNGVILTHRPLYDNEMFEVRIDRVIDKWSGSIEMGVTTHNPEHMRFPSTMTNMETGTIMMSGSKILVNGYGTCTDYGNVNLDELRVGDRIALRKTNDKLHYYINGEDQGVAADSVDSKVWGVVDLYGMTVKVTIIDGMEDNNVIDMPTEICQNVLPPHILRPRRRELSLSFHSLRNSNVVVVDGGKTAHRPFTHESVNNGLIMTNRTLKTDELFQVRLDMITPISTDSIAIGVTQLTCNDVTYPYKLMSAQTGTWALIASDIIKDGDVVIPHYVRSIDRLSEGDTIGVMRKDMGMLHFFVNGLDQGPAAFNVPEHVFGIIELHGKLAKATIVDLYIPRTLPVEPPKYVSTKAYPDLCFHSIRGPNGELDQDRMVATREPNVCEYNYCIFFSSRPIRECEMFEIRVDKLFQSFGTLSIGVTGLKPEDVNFCNIGLAIGLSADSYILNGSCLFKSSNIIASKYPLDLNLVQEGTRIGVMWHSDRTIHFYMDGMDYGPAFCVPHFNVYAIIDLFGSCSQVTYLPNEDRCVNYTTNTEIYTMGIPWTLTLTQSPYSFSEYCGQNVVVMENFSVARRRQVLDPTSSLVFSAGHLVVDEIFEIRIIDCSSPCAGSIRIGVTDINILNAYINRALPNSIANLPHYTVFIEGENIRYSNAFNEPLPEYQTMTPSFDFVRPFDRIGLKKTADQKVRIYFNSESCQAYFERVPDKVYVVIELFGNLLSIQAISKLSKNETTRYQPCIERELKALEMAEFAKMTGSTTDNNSKSAAIANSRKRSSTFSFLRQHGNQIKLFSSDTVAKRMNTCTNGVVIVRQRLKRGNHFMFRVDQVKANWLGNICVGAISSTRSLKVPLTAFGFKNCKCWIIAEDCKNICGRMGKSNDGAPLRHVREQSILKLQYNWDNTLVLILDNKYKMHIDRVPKNCRAIYPIIDVYGKVKQVSILFHPLGMSNSTSLNLAPIAENRFEETEGPEYFPPNLPVSLSEHDLDKNRRISSELMNLWLQQNMPALTCEEIIPENVGSPTASNASDTDFLHEISELPTDVVSTPILDPETLSEIQYFKWLISNVDSPEQNDDELTKYWLEAAENCSNLRNAFEYWKSLTAQFLNLGPFLSKARVQCFCENCDPDAFPHLSGWIRIEKSEISDHLYWHPKREVFDVPYSIDALLNNNGNRPDVYHSLPKIIPDIAPVLWYNEEGVALHIRISIEVTLIERDELNSLMLHIKPAPPRNETEE